MLMALLPLGLEPGDTHVGDRLAIHAAGLLTLVAFKYSVSTDLPIVPYGTFTTGYLTRQIITTVGVSIECVVSYKLVVLDAKFKPYVDWFEDVILVALISFW